MVKKYQNRKQIIFQKQPPSVFYGKAIENGKMSVAKLNSENYQ